MRDAQAPITFYRTDYQAPNHKITETTLHFKLDAKRTVVKSTLQLAPWNDQTPEFSTLVLDGEDLELLSLSLNDTPLTASDYLLTENNLTINKTPRTGTLAIEVAIYPEKNTRLEGLYTSNGNFFTQCEAQGFRRITYFPDRPDVLSRFSVTLEHNVVSHPTALSNGNFIDETDLTEGWRQTRWEDPFPKPAYLFALVAGQFECQEETITRSNGKNALLQVWVEPGNLDKTDFAMQSLKKSVQWDRNRFGLELDLDRFMIVATADFNMGAMENKGLNIFNTRFVFANPKLATDSDFEHVESVVGHEYFHNWTGNRVTCRDWFQLSLKEGLTVFRDQEFTSDMLAHGLEKAQADSARAVKRIDDVKVLRGFQFPEDSGPMAHPIRPDSYQEINNFYTITVYEKGAEVIRMQHTLLGEKGFQRGMQIYFERHDGQAVTCDDFVDCMQTALQEQAPDRNLDHFRQWYSQAGTPQVNAKWSYNPKVKTLTLKLSQHCAATPGQTTKPPFYIPLRMGLVNPEGHDVPLQLNSKSDRLHGDVLILSQAEESYEFTNIPNNVIPSLLRSFSAPIKLRTQHTLNDLKTLAEKDNDAFNRWDAGQEIYSQAIFSLLNNPDDNQAEAVQSALSVFESSLDDLNLSDGYKALLLQLPSESTLFENAEGLTDPVALHQAWNELKNLLTTHCLTKLEHTYNTRHLKTPYQYNAIEAGQRSLKNTVLGYICKEESHQRLALKQCEEAQHMTDRIAALTHLVHNGGDYEQALEQFYTDFKHEALVLDKWFAVQASQPVSSQVDVLTKIKALMKHPDFTLKNPNRSRSILTSLTIRNPSVFHSHDGQGYAIWADAVIALNTLNPQVAARLARALDRWTKLPQNLQAQAKKSLSRIIERPDLSNDVQEIISKSLNNTPI